MTGKNGSISTILLVLFTLLSGCFINRELPVEYDYSYQGRFGKYNTYDFVNQLDHETFINQGLKETITTSIQSHMDFLGYKKKPHKPDLLLSFRIFVDSLQMKGYLQPEINEWAKRQNRDLDYTQEDIAIKKGTIYIQIIDLKQNKAIWQGYATDNYNRVDLNDRYDVKNAVASILNKYQFFSKEFMEQQRAIKRGE